MAVNIQVGSSVLDIPLNLLRPSSWNPNEMPQAKFNALYDGMEEHGCLEPLLVRGLGDGTYEVVGGHHRLEVAILLAFESLPCVTREWDDDTAKLHNMRMNVIRGKINPEKFTRMFEELQAKFPDRDIAKEMGIVSDEELARLILATAKTLPPEMQQAFEDAKKRIKTVDDLVIVLNELFMRQGDQLEKMHYMILDFEGRESIWIRVPKDRWKDVKILVVECAVRGVPVDEAIMKLLMEFDKKEADEFFSDLIPEEAA